MRFSLFPKALLAGAAALSLTLAGVLPATADRVETNVIGGDPIEITTVPWQVALLNADVPNDFQAQYCGGSLLNSRWVVTAAHCMFLDNNPIPANKMAILAGKADLGLTPETSGPRVAVSQKILHPDYNPTTEDNDIALLRLATPVTLDGVTKKAVALPTAEDPDVWPAADAEAYISGWGSMQDPNPDDLYPADLQGTPTKVQTDPLDPDCGSHGVSYNKDTMLCAGDPPNTDTCYGDSGGPLTVGEVLAGITSWGKTCAEVGYPGIYTRVTTYVDWITAQIATQPLFTATPTSLRFASQQEKTTSAAQKVTVRNTGSAPLVVSRVGIEGANRTEFGVTANTCATLAANATCTTSVVFKPTSAGTKTATLTFTDDASGSPHRVVLSGVATAAPPPPPPPPAKPGMVITRATTKKVKVTWGKVTGATKYDVRITGKTKKGKKVKKTKTVSKVRLTLKLKLKPNSKYKACVRSVGPGGKSAYKCKSARVFGF